jgi:hypothetical protein
MEHKSPAEESSATRTPCEVCGSQTYYKYCSEACETIGTIRAELVDRLRELADVKVELAAVKAERDARRPNAKFRGVLFGSFGIGYVYILKKKTDAGRGK